MFNSYEIFYDRTRKRWLLNTGACLIEATTWACLTVCWIDMHIKYSLPDCSRLEVSLNRKCISLKQHYCYSILAILLYKSHTKSIYSCDKYCNVYHPYVILLFSSLAFSIFSWTVNYTDKCITSFQKHQ
jgi:hypothetical protein